MARRILVLRDGTQPPAGALADRVITSQELRRWAASGELLRQAFRYDDAQLVVTDADLLTNPFKVALLLRALSRGPIGFLDAAGRREEIGVGGMVGLMGEFLRDQIVGRAAIQRAASEVERLSDWADGRQDSPAPVMDPEGTPVYLRTDWWFGVLAGGSVGHIAGVLNHLGEFCGQPIFLSTDHVPTVRGDVETHIIRPSRKLRNVAEVRTFAFNRDFSNRAVDLLGGRTTGFVYQRYGVNSYAAVWLARTLGVPLVTEYNGSELWVRRNWGDGTVSRYEELSERIEQLNLTAAEVVVVVSEPLGEELIARGVRPERVLVNPNGVDAERYNPHVSGSQVRDRYGLHGKTVVGFIGTFGRWHGAEVLAEAVGLLLRARPELGQQLRLLLIGDGATMPEVRQQIARYGIADASVLTGLIPQQEGPAYLAAADILVAPHVPNPDGSAFFGSPTKLFEYMAMGRGIVASDLGQIGQVLRDDETALLVRPGDAHDLARGIGLLIDDPERRARLGAAARREVVAGYTWREHTRRIVDKLREQCG